jgi:hypothetical protein
MKKSIIVALSLLLPSVAGAQSVSLEEFAAQVDERSQTLDGYRSYLTDPDPNRAMAALQIMLESGEPGLVQMALSEGLYSPNPEMRQTALKAYMAGKPSIGLYFDGASVTEELMEEYNHVVTYAYRGGVGPEKQASTSFKVGEWSDELGCYLNQNIEGNCLARINATTVSILLPGFDDNISGNEVPPQWVTLSLGDDGKLTGGVTPRQDDTIVGPLTVTMRLAE